MNNGRRIIVIGFRLMCVGIIAGITYKWAPDLVKAAGIFGKPAEYGHAIADAALCMKR